MALYDDYFTNEDKPFAENLNDALLLSNVFDMTVNIEFPKMFSNSTWVNTTSPRKCGVALLTLKEGLPNGISVSTADNESVLSGTGTVKLSFYPNFNAFGKFKSFNWTNDGTVAVNLKTTEGITIASNISKGNIENQSSELRTLQEIVIEIVMTNATLKTFEVVMENKQQTRYGATVGITDVTGLDDRFDSVADEIAQKQSKEIGKGLSANDFTNALKTKLENVNVWETIREGSIQNMDCNYKLEVNSLLRLAHLTCYAKVQFFQQNNYLPFLYDSYGLDLNDYMPTAEEHYAVCHGANASRIATIKKDEESAKRFMIHTDATDRQVTYIVDTMWKY